MATPNEEWRPIPGHEGHYEVSNHGRVRSLDRVLVTKAGVSRRQQGRELQLISRREGYLTVGINGPRYVHRLVLEAFEGPCPAGMECRHLDGNPANNHFTNLAWGTPSENNHDIVTHGTHNLAKKAYCKRGHKLEEPNLAPSMLKKGHRSCLACSRARAHAQHHGLSTHGPGFQQLADQKHSVITA